MKACARSLSREDTATNVVDSTDCRAGITLFLAISARRGEGRGRGGERRGEERGKIDLTFQGLQNIQGLKRFIRTDGEGETLFKRFYFIEVRTSCSCG